MTGKVIPDRGRGDSCLAHRIANLVQPDNHIPGSKQVLCGFKYEDIVITPRHLLDLEILWFYPVIRSMLTHPLQQIIA